jgi:hypothetical protein
MYTCLFTDCVIFDYTSRNLFCYFCYRFDHYCQFSLINWGGGGGIDKKIK